MLGAGFQVDGSPTGPDAAPPRLGEHTRAVLSSLGYSDEALGALEAAGVIEVSESGTGSRQA